MIDVMKQALEYIKATNKSSSFWLVPASELNKTVTALHLAIEQAEKQEPVAWKNAAIRLGEELSSVGPDGYYDMTAEQWLSWAMDQRPRGKNSLAAPPQRQPLTEDEIEQATGCDRTKPLWIAIESVARAVERKHGIGGGE